MIKSSWSIESMDISTVIIKKPEVVDGESQRGLLLRVWDRLISLSVRGFGHLGAYSSQHPLRCPLWHVKILVSA
ncbi:hypothetical protein Bca4012_039365 [Brassica carinata]|uniref:Uncharacterized protein n=1 Tax=Brassica carinata TaxID=52824 RepID=A0A8X7W6J1_BRACI|nr:hypothetical protein Bca52824_007597 [Brassica carinata]